MSRWQDTVVRPHETLEAAIAVIDRTALRIALVADDRSRLLGTLTDGDVRRTLLRREPLDTPVSRIMCRSPLTGRPDWGRDRALAVMEANKLLHLPIIDETGRLVGLQTLQGLLDRTSLNNPVLLMAGGFGTRLRPLTENLPKPLIKVGEKPILELIVTRLVSAGFHRFFISTHFLPEMVRSHFGDGSEWGATIRYVHEDTPLDTAGAVGLLPKTEMEAPLLVVNGDLLTTIDFRALLAFHQQHSPSATMCVREYQHQVPYGVIQVDGHDIRSFVEKPVQSYLVNGGIYVLSPELVARVPAGRRVSMPTLLEEAMARKERVMMFPLQDYWLDIGRMEDLKRAQVDAEDLLP